MPGVDTKIRHYHVNHETGERTLNTDFNVFIALNAISYIIFVILIFTVGPFGGVRSTTDLLAYRYRTVMTPDAVFFKIVWAIVVPWHAFWVIWQIVQPGDRNCDGVVRASYFYPFMTCLYAGYAISCRFDAIILGTIFAYGLCGTMVGLIMSMQRYREKMLPGYLIWQGPHSLLGAWIMVEAVLMTNIVFVKLGEEWIIKVIMGCVSLVVLFVTAIAWLSSYPVDLLVPSVLCYAVGGIYIELLSPTHYTRLFQQGYNDDWLTGAKYTVLAVFVLILISIFLKILVVLIHQRPREHEERRRHKDSRVSLSITIDTGKNNNNSGEKKKKPRKNRDRDYSDGDYDNNDYYDDGNDEERPPRRNQNHRRGSGERRGSNGSRGRGGYNSGERRYSNDEQQPRRSRSKPRGKKGGPRRKDNSSTSYDDDYR